LLRRAPAAWPERRQNGRDIRKALRREALTLGETAFGAHDITLGRDHDLTKDSARVTSDALDVLGRTEEVKALRERNGVMGQRK
jgi:hypothetical protein